MRLLHNLYRALSTDWFAVPLLLSIVASVIIARRATTRQTAIALCTLAVFLTIGWMMVDSVLYPARPARPGPFEALGQVALLIPIALATLLRLLRLRYRD